MSDTGTIGNVRKLHVLGKQLLENATEYEKPAIVLLPESDIDSVLYLLNVLDEYVYRSQYFCNGWVSSQAEGFRFIALPLSFTLRDVIERRYSREYALEAAQQALLQAELPRDRETFLRDKEYWLQKQETAQMVFDLVVLMKEQLL